MPGMKTRSPKHEPIMMIQELIDAVHDNAEISG